MAIAPLVAAGRASLAATPTFVGNTTGAIQNTIVDEASGIAASRRNPNVLYTHNDSGGNPEVYAMTPAGVTLGTYPLSGASFSDWEDIAVGPGPAAGTNYLYLGDIGDNDAKRASVQVYRVPEPAISDTQSPPVTLALSGVSKFNFTYPDGKHDAESLFVDPLTKDIYIISKRDPTKHVYRAAYPQSTSSDPTVMEKVTELPNADWITAADISPDGNEIIMRANAATSGLMYIRPPGGTIADAFATTPISIPLFTEVQGEAIGFDPQGWGYYTTSEGKNAPINYFNRLPPPAGTMYWDNDAMAAGSSATTGAALGGSGSWDTAALKWYNASSDVAWANGNNAVFWGSAGSVTLAAAQSVNSLNFKTSGYVISGSTLTIGGSGSINVDAGLTATISSVIAGTAGLVKNGAGTLLLKTANTYSGGTTINGGILGVVSSSVGANPTSPVINITVNNGATLRFDINNLVLAVNRNVLLGAGGGTFDVQSFSNGIAGVISGLSSFTKAGAGTLTLSNENIYAGATNVLAGTLVLTRNLTTTSAINVSTGATVNVTAGTGAVLKTSNVSVPGKVDLADNKLIVTSMPLGSWTGSTYNGITGLLQSGRGDGSWNGTSGIVTTMTSATTSSLTTLAIATAADAGKDTFAGLSVSATDILVMYTYGGDANLDGKLNIDDYVRIDNGIAGGLTGWANGDFNYDGKINVDDYTTVIDVNLGNQNGTFSSANGVVAIPEPAAVLLLLPWGLPLRGKRRPRRS